MMGIQSVQLSHHRPTLSTPQSIKCPVGKTFPLEKVRERWWFSWENSNCGTLTSSSLWCLVSLDWFR